MPEFDDGLAETELPAGRVETDVLIVDPARPAGRRRYAWPPSGSATS